MMPISLCRSFKLNSTEYIRPVEVILVSPGDNPSSEKPPKFMSNIIEVLQIPESESGKSRPLSLKEDLVIEASRSMPFFAEVVKKAWFASVKSDTETLSEHIEKLKRNVGI